MSSQTQHVYKLTPTPPPKKKSRKRKNGMEKRMGWGGGVEGNMKQSPAFREYDKDKQVIIPRHARLFPFRNLSGGLFSSFIIRFGPIQISQTASSASYQSIRFSR